MPNRELRSGIRESEAIDLLTVAAEVFFYRLLVTVDDYGRFHANPPLLRAALFPLRIDKVKEADVNTWMIQCQKAGLIDLYKVECKPYLQVRKFNQRLRAAHSKFPGPDGQMLLDVSNPPALARPMSDTGPSKSQELDKIASFEQDTEMPVIGPSNAGHPRSNTESDTESESSIDIRIGDALRAAWDDWKAYRKERKLPAYGDRGERAQLNRLASWGEIRALAAIKYSMAQNYQGIYEENGTHAAKPKSRFAGAF